MIIRMKRLTSDHMSTIGFLSIEDVNAFTTEDAFHVAKIKGQTRIPAGEYEIKLRADGGMHPKYLQQFHEIHKGMLHLQDVPGFEWVYIHVGNNYKNTEGCILVGRVADLDTMGISKSVIGYKKLYSKIVDVLDTGEEVFIKITDEQG